MLYTQKSKAQLRKLTTYHVLILLSFLFIQMTETHAMISLNGIIIPGMNFHPAVTVISNPTVKVLFNESKYIAGDQVTVNIELKDSNSEPLYFHEYSWELFENGTSKTKYFNVTDENGKATVKFRLPDIILSRSLLLKITTNHDGKMETISEWVPLNMQ